MASCNQSTVQYSACAYINVCIYYYIQSKCHTFVLLDESFTLCLQWLQRVLVLNTSGAVEQYFDQLAHVLFVKLYQHMHKDPYTQQPVCGDVTHFSSDRNLVPFYFNFFLVSHISQQIHCLRQKLQIFSGFCSLSVRSCCFYLYYIIVN